MENKKVCVGDWVAFYRDGRITISKVEYIEDSCLGKEYCTNDGKVSEKYILEARGRVDVSK